MFVWIVVVLLVFIVGMYVVGGLWVRCGFGVYSLMLWKMGCFRYILNWRESVEVEFG